MLNQQETNELIDYEIYYDYFVFGYILTIKMFWISYSAIDLNDR